MESRNQRNRNQNVTVCQYVPRADAEYREYIQHGGGIIGDKSGSIDYGAYYQMDWYGTFSYLLSDVG